MFQVYRLVGGFTLSVVTASLVLGGCETGLDGAQVAAHQEPNVYGSDDRVDFYGLRDALEPELASRFERVARDSTAMMIRESRLRFGEEQGVELCQPSPSSPPEGWESACLLRTLDWSVFASSDFGDDEIPLCPDVAFADQPKVGRCSATLIDEDLVLTSGHCLDEEGDLESTAFVFGWRYEREPDRPARRFGYRVRVVPESEPAYTHEIGRWMEMPAPGMAPVTRRDVYHARRVRWRYFRNERLRPSGSTTRSVVYDYAVVQLDRPVSLPRRPASVELRREALTVGTPLVGVSYGKGMPLKADLGAQVISHWYCDADFNPGLFCNTHDAFSGGSGGGVFTGDGRLLGAHRGSADDFVLDPVAGCFRIREVAEEVPESEFSGSAQHAAWALEHFCSFGFEGEAHHTDLCGQERFILPDGETCTDGALEAHDGQVCCVRSCETDADCMTPTWGGRCTEAGTCQRVASCFAGELWERDACGRPVERVEGSEERCIVEGDACGDPFELPVMNDTLVVDVAGARDRLISECGGSGPEKVWHFRLGEPYRFEASLGGGSLTESEIARRGWLLYLRREECTDVEEELACAQVESGGEVTVSRLLEAGDYYLVVDTEPDPLGETHPWTESVDLSVLFEPLRPSPPDASVPDASIPDAAVMDASTVPDLDGGTPLGDAMPTPNDMDDSGCGCRVVGLAPSSPGVGWGLGFIGLVLYWRRRSREAHRSGS